MSNISRSFHRLIHGTLRYFSTKPQRPYILGIETSCDDTGAAVVSKTGEILGEALASQLRTHLRFGGIVPPVAADLHRQHIESVVEKAMQDSNLTFNDLDAIAVTNRPGLQLSLFVGLRYAKHLARKHSKPIIPVHHMEAHALTVRMTKHIDFPFLCLLVSGGHCLLSLVKNIDEFYLLGESIDDAPGEAFDKIARRLKLRNIKELSQMSGGQAMETAARSASDINKYDFPLPLARQRDCQFSFAGLKNTAQRHIWREEKEVDLPVDGIIPGYKEFSASFLKAITRHIAHRTQRAIEILVHEGIFKDKVRTIVVAGGVACNDFLFNAISQLGEQFDFQVVRPTKHLCTDNGVMIAWNGIERFSMGSSIVHEKDFDKIEALGRSPLGENWIEKVKAANHQCKWAKIPILQ